MRFGGPILVVCGVIYIIKPLLFKRGIWKQTSVAQNAFSEKGYIVYMRLLGVAFTIWGIYLTWRDFIDHS